MVRVMLKKVKAGINGKKTIAEKGRFLIKPNTVERYPFFLNKIIKDDFVVLKYKNGINFLLIVK